MDGSVFGCVWAGGIFAVGWMWGKGIFGDLGEVGKKGGKGMMGERGFARMDG